MNEGIRGEKRLGCLLCPSSCLSPLSPPPSHSLHLSSISLSLSLFLLTSSPSTSSISSPFYFFSSLPTPALCFPYLLRSQPVYSVRVVNFAQLPKAWRQRKRKETTLHPDALSSPCLHLPSFRPTPTSIIYILPQPVHFHMSASQLLLSLVAPPPTCFLASPQMPSWC